MEMDERMELARILKIANILMVIVLIAAMLIHHSFYRETWFDLFTGAACLVTVIRYFLEKGSSAFRY